MPTWNGARRLEGHGVAVDHETVGMNPDEVSRSSGDRSVRVDQHAEAGAVEDVDA
jgi:hypothetical protein